MREVMIEQPLSPMKKHHVWILGFTLLLSLLLMVGPSWLFPPCSGKVQTASGTTIPMRCLWTGRAVTGFAVLLGVATGLALLGGDPKGARFAAAVNVVNAILLVLTPLFIIPTCSNPMMSCNAGMKPVVVMAALALLIANAVLLLSGGASRCTSES